MGWTSSRANTRCGACNEWVCSAYSANCQECARRYCYECVELHPRCDTCWAGDMSAHIARELSVGMEVLSSYCDIEAKRLRAHLHVVRHDMKTLAHTVAG